MALLSTKSQWSLVNSQSPKKTLIGQKKKHEITPPDPKYFQCLQIQPGSAFFRALLECKYPIGTLSLNIPAMLVNLGFSVLLRTSITSISRTTIDKQGKLKITENVKMEKFVRRLEKRTDKLYADQPLIYIQEINDKHPWQEIETPITRREMCERYARGPSYNQIFKQYVRSAGERMQMYRLFYYASRKAPIAVTFVKKVKFEDPRYVPEEKFLVSDTQLELVDTFAQSGKSIERMQLEAKKLCSFLSRAYGFRVEEFVADFVKDKSDIYWLVNVKSFILENSNYHVKKLEHEKLIENQAVLLELLREQANDSTTCKLCGFRFNRATKGRRVTAHTLLELREHLRRRGIDLTINFKVKAEEFLSHTVTVCEMCYAVAIAEHHLMNIEREFARAQNIPVKIQNVPIDVGGAAGPGRTVSQPVLPTTILQQWRVLFYFDYIVTNDSEAPLTEFKEYYLQFKLFDHITKFPFTYSANSKNLNYKLNFLRVHYFFSLTKDINSTLKEMLVDIRITEGESWDHAIYSGKSMSLHDFMTDYCSFETILLPKCVSLFSADITQHLAIQAIIGLTCDKEIDVGMYNLYKASNVYYTDDSYYSSYPFPSEWIELFKAAARKRDQEAQMERFTVGMNIKYEPVISPREIFNIKMIKSIGKIRSCKSTTAKMGATYSPYQVGAKSTLPNIESFNLSNPSIMRSKSPATSNHTKDYNNSPSDYYKTAANYKDSIKKELILELKTCIKRENGSSLTTTHLHKKKRRKMFKEESPYRTKVDWSEYSTGLQLNSTKSTNEVLDYMGRHPLMESGYKGKRTGKKSFSNTLKKL